MSQADINLTAQLEILRDQWRAELTAMQGDWDTFKTGIEANPINVPVKMDDQVTAAFQALKASIESQVITVPVVMQQVGGGGGGAVYNTITSTSSNYQNYQNAQQFNATQNNITDNSGDDNSDNSVNNTSNSGGGGGGRSGGGGWAGANGIFGRYLAFEFARKSAENAIAEGSDIQKIGWNIGDEKWDASDDTTDTIKAAQENVKAERDLATRQNIASYLLGPVGLGLRWAANKYEGGSPGDIADETQQTVDQMQNEERERKQILDVRSERQRLGLQGVGDEDPHGVLQADQRRADISGIDPLDKAAKSQADINEKYQQQVDEIEKEADLLRKKGDSEADVLNFIKKGTAIAGEIAANAQQWADRQQAAATGYRLNSIDVARERLAGNTDQADMSELLAKQRRERTLTPDSELSDFNKQAALDVDILQQQQSRRQAYSAFQSNQAIGETNESLREAQMRATGNNRGAEDASFAAKLTEKLDDLLAKANAATGTVARTQLFDQAHALDQDTPGLIQAHTAEEQRKDQEEIKQINEDAEQDMLQSEGQFYRASEEAAKEHYANLIQLAEENHNEQLVEALKHERDMAQAERDAVRRRETDEINAQADIIGADAGLHGYNPRLKGAGAALELRDRTQKEIAAAAGDPDRQAAIAAKAANEAKADQAKEKDKNAADAYGDVARDFSHYGGARGLTPDNILSQSSPYMLDGNGTPVPINRGSSYQRTDASGRPIATAMTGSQAAAARQMKEFMDMLDFGDGTPNNKLSSSEKRLSREMEDAELHSGDNKSYEKYLRSHYSGDAGEIQGILKQADIYNFGNNQGASAIGNASQSMASAAANPFGQSIAKWSDTVDKWTDITNKIESAPTLVVLSS